MYMHLRVQGKGGHACTRLSREDPAMARQGSEILALPTGRAAGYRVNASSAW